MGIAPPLSPRLIQELIQAEEADLRGRTLTPATVEAIFRYGAVVGTKIERHRSLSRGMERARDLIRDYEMRDESFPSGMVILADELTDGRGRFQRGWHAPPGGIWLTLVLVNILLPENNSLTPLAVGMACCETIRHYGIDARIKWVNDIHVANRKIGGVLCQTMIGPRFGEEYTLIGVGINVNNRSFPPELQEAAISMTTLLGEEITTELFAARLLAKLSWNIGLVQYREECLLAARDSRYEQESDATDVKQDLLLSRWLQLSDTIGQRVKFGFDVQQAPQYEAEAMAIDAHGGLILRRLADGIIVTENAGEIIYF